MRIVKTFTITTSNEELMTRLEMLLVQMQYNSIAGHSAYFGMFVDGDGQDRIEIEGLWTANYPQVKQGPTGDLEHPISSSATYGRKNFRQ